MVNRIFSSFIISQSRSTSSHQVICILRTFLSCEEKAIEFVLQHGPLVLAVGSFATDLLSSDFEPGLLDYLLDHVVAGFNARFPCDVGKVVLQRSKVDPITAGFQNAVNELDELQDIVGAI